MKKISTRMVVAGLWLHPKHIGISRAVKGKLIEMMGPDGEAFFVDMRYVNGFHFPTKELRV
ncbi:hypothetical protein [Bacillus sp. mrc49]|uniref:hypothetical protein n=1 Tax=Bacillus sp. mrc49 TaxID=2054913 RepID=UPI000C27980F|nr:hypothetical protein [Bacillus sp. mrc49]PJN89273.1 hypothetical protein CVN76_16040 [Bacillus sp. mrc49]